MNEELTGGCLCGAVRYIVKAEALPVCYACHCTDCQTQSGSAFGLQMPLSESVLSISGPLREGTREMPSGSTGSIYSCEKCAVRIYAANSARPEMRILRAGTLDRSKEIEPGFHLWTDSKQSWVSIPDDAGTMATQPDTPEQWKKLFAGSL